MIICFENVPTVLKHLNDTLQTTDFKRKQTFRFQVFGKIELFSRATASTQPNVQTNV